MSNLQIVLSEMVSLYSITLLGDDNQWVLVGKDNLDYQLLLKCLLVCKGDATDYHNQKRDYLMRASAFMKSDRNGLACYGKAMAILHSDNITSADRAKLIIAMEDYILNA